MVGKEEEEEEELCVAMTHICAHTLTRSVPGWRVCVYTHI